MGTHLLRIERVLDARGIKKSQHYADIQAGLFTRPIKIGKRASAWPAHEIYAINAARIAGKSEDEIKKLVAELESARMIGAGG
jgi:prophage regulatory protein